MAPTTANGLYWPRFRFKFTVVDWLYYFLTTSRSVQKAESPRHIISLQYPKLDRKPLARLILLFFKNNIIIIITIFFNFIIIIYLLACALILESRSVRYFSYNANCMTSLNSWVCEPKRQSRRYIKSQCFWLKTSTTPQGYFLPLKPSLSPPITAKGSNFYH